MSPLQQMKQKLLEHKALLEHMGRWKADGQRVVFTNGCFDILHPGHIDYLAKAASLGDKLIIGLNTDASVSRLKGDTRPIQKQDARAMILAALLFVDAITLFDEDTPAALIADVKPDILVKGADYAIEQIAGADTVMKHGGSVVLLPYLKGYSTSSIEDRMRKGS